MNGDMPDAGVPIGKPGGLRWPGRERLSPRDRALLEARTFTELVLVTVEVEGDPEEVLGCFACLWLEASLLRAGDPRAWGPSGVGPHGRDGAPLDCWRALCN